MSLPFGQNLFPPKGEILINYDWIDVADGTGIINFYGFNSKEQSVDSYNLSRESLYSHNFQTSGNVTGAGAWAKILDVDFDSILNLPKNIKGKFMANIMFGADDTSTGDTSVNVYAKVILRKWDGTTETTIAAMQSETLSVAAATQHYITACVKSNITSSTHFKKGDTLRVTVELWGDSTGANDRVITFYHDPLNRHPQTSETNGFSYDTYLNFYIPFKLNI